MIDASAVARGVGVSAEFQDLRGGAVLFLPQRIAVFAQGASSVDYSMDKVQLTSAPQAGLKGGYGSPIHLIARELFPENGDGVGTIPVTWYPLDAYEGTPAAGTITPSGSQVTKKSYKARIAGILSVAFIIDEGDSVAERCTAITTAINAVLAMPVIAADNTTAVGLTAKWGGETGNGIIVEIIGETDADTVFTISQPTSGATNPDVETALAQMGDIWETMLLNGLNYDDTDVLDVFQEFGDGRRESTVKKHCLAFVGSNDVDVATIQAVTDDRTDDAINCILTAPGSVNLPCVIAARELARIVVRANNNPPTDYGSLRATRLIPGDDGDQWDYATRDAAVKAGISTIRVKDGVVTLADTVTMYRPDGEEPPAFRYVVDEVKIQQVVYNANLLFDNEFWDGMPLIPDDQPTVNPNARKPSTAVAAVAGMLDSLGDNAIISDPAGAKKTIVAVINAQNPKRLDLTFTARLSGNANIVDAVFTFGFFFSAA